MNIPKACDVRKRCQVVGREKEYDRASPGARVQPRWIQGILKRDGVDDLERDR